MGDPDSAVDVDSRSAKLSSTVGDLSSNKTDIPGPLIAKRDQTSAKQPSDPPAEPPVTGEDCGDDVQFMYCAPKSKRKKRKRSDRVERIEGKVDPPAVDASPSCIIKPEQEPRRASDGMIEQFESWHIRPDEDVPIPVRIGSLPAIAIPTKQISIPNLSQSDQFDSPGKSVPPKPPCLSLPQHSALPATWKELPMSPPGKDWRPICFDGHSAKRQKRDEPTGVIATNSANSSQLPQISPKAISSSIPSPFQLSARNTDYLDMLGSSSMQDMRGLTLPNNVSDISSLEFGCSQPMNNDPRYNRLYYHPGPISLGPSSPMSFTSPHLNSQSSNTTSSQQLRNSMQAEWGRSPTCIPQSSNGSSGDVSLPNFPIFRQRQHQSTIPPQSQSALQSILPTRSNAQPSSDRLPISNNPSLFWRTPRPPYLNQPRVANQNMLHDSLTQSADIMRKPSLYKIPPWSSNSNTNPSDSLTGPGSNSQQLASGNKSPISEQASHSECVPIFANRPFGHTMSRQVENRQGDAHVTTSSNGHDEQFSKHPTTEAFDPNHSPKQGRHEHSPNLVVDIAETCQRLFPFSDVAARHNKPVQKVFDTFSAIIQIPLLRNAQDNRRHGNLGKRRLREYREAKKAMAMDRAKEEANLERVRRVER